MCDAVDVGVGHQDDLVVADLLDVELVADAGADRLDERLDLLVLQHLVDAGALDVEDLAADRAGSPGTRGSRACFALPPALSPSTMNSSHSLGSFDEQSASLPGIADDSSSDLRRVRSRAWRAATRARGRLQSPCCTIARALGRVLLEPVGELLVGGLLDHRPHLGVAELGLGLALELRVAQLHRDDRGEALADVLAEEVVVLLLEEALALARTC